MSIQEHVRRITGAGEDILAKDYHDIIIHGLVEVDEGMSPDLVVARRRTIARPLGVGMMQLLTLEHLSEQTIASVRRADNLSPWVAQISNRLEASRPFAFEGATAPKKDTSIGVIVNVDEDSRCMSELTYDGPLDDALAETDMEFWRQWGVVDLRCLNIEGTAHFAGNMLPNSEELIATRLSEIE